MIRVSGVLPSGAKQSEMGHIPDNTISTLTQLLCHRVSLIDNKVLVEHLEHLSAL
jgi:hypothetical protein